MMDSKPTSQIFVRVILCFGFLAASASAFAAGVTLNPPDSNSRIVVENALVNGQQTTVLFWSYPDLGDPGSGKECPLNFYTVTLQSGLSAAQPELMAKNVCGNGLAHARLLDNGDALIMARSHLERWRAGKKINSHAISDLGATAKSGFDPAYGGQLYYITPAGDITVAAPLDGSAQTGDDSNVWAITRIDEAGKQDWKLRFNEPGQRTTIEGVWAANKGGTLVRVSAMPADYSSINSQEYLYFIDAQGTQTKPLQLSIDDQPDIKTLMSLGQADIQRALARLGESKPERIEKLSARVRADGGFDVLLQRQGGAPGRAGHFLLKFNSDGAVAEEVTLTERVTPYGLENWFGFNVAGDQLILLSPVLATQHGVQASRKKWRQNVVSWIDLEGSAAPLSRLIPLDMRYLEAAMNAGDAEMQYLDGLPGGDPALLTTLAGAPLVASIGITTRQPALRLNEANDQLLAYTEAYDEGQAKLAKAQAREQHQADKHARKQQMNADMATAVGMTPEAFAALSNKEQKEVMVRQGDFAAMNAAVMKQAPAVQNQAAENGNAVQSDTQMLAAMMQGLPPELAAQIQAAMAKGQPAREASAPVAAQTEAAIESFKMSVMEVFTKPDGRIIIGGKIDIGNVAVGDSICLLSGKIDKRQLKVEGIEMFGAAVESARTGEVAGLQVTGISQGEADRGDELQATCGQK